MLRRQAGRVTAGRADALSRSAAYGTAPAGDCAGLHAAGLALELKAATAKVEHAALCHPPSDAFGERIEMAPPVLLEPQKTRLAQHSKMLRRVVLRNPDA